MTDLRQAAQQALEALQYGKPNKAITILREALEREHAMHELARLGQEIEQEPTPWRDMVVVSLVREGINKHKARELADHFAAQRPWQGLTDEEIEMIEAGIGYMGRSVTAIIKEAEAKLKELNK